MTASRAALTRDSLQLKITSQQVRLGGQEYRVISPAKPLKNGALYKTRSSYDMFVDRADGRRIGALWLLAARSPRSLVYLPTRTAAMELGIDFDREEKPLDLVLAHQAVQFRPSLWKKLRARITAGNAPREVRTASVPERDLPAETREINYVAPSDPAHRNLLHQHVFAETLFLTGSTTAFREAAPHIFAVTKEGPPAAATQLYISGGCNYHVCRSIYLRPDLRAHNGEQFHVEFCPPWSR
ncbi:hypothetical protein OHA45_34460 [Streptomyces lydicus]|uniref:hypothetical protein n=1 Tax=Streptomyces lydicus TaxID=47763 RepID=UPI002E370421|nr:hypothetical protein [Streptomyces lydicus]